jgi:hypothetical protein
MRQKSNSKEVTAADVRSAIVTLLPAVTLELSESAGFTLYCEDEGITDKTEAVKRLIREFLDERHYTGANPFGNSRAILGFVDSLSEDEIRSRSSRHSLLVNDSIATALQMQMRCRRGSSQSSNR